MDYRQIPALAAYIDRIGAEQLNFRQFMVREYKQGYYTEKSFIKIDRDGTISCSNIDHEPTEDEAAAIKIALQGVSFPLYVAAPYAQMRSLRLMLADQQQTEDANLVLYEFFSRQDDKLVMVQQRKPQRDGNKKYIPWTFWSDGIWRAMEPDTKLPLWKPRTTTNKAKIMVHEGAKAAQAMHLLCNSLDHRLQLEKHPWRDDLVQYEHWGMIGGALAPQRTDWASLRSEKALDVVYVCDNDFLGKSAIKAVSSNLKYTLKSVMVDSRFPIAWDMADPMPNELFTADGRWRGPTFHNLLKPATWATEKIKVEGSKKPVVSMRREFIEEWMHSVNPEVFIHKQWPADRLTADQFNTKLRPYSDTKNISDLLKQDPAGKTAVIKYTPALPGGIFFAQGAQFINTHEPTEIRRETGDPTPWLHFLATLIPDDDDRKEMMRWCATLIARPEIKMMYGVLLISETQGVGKGTLGEKILAPLVGDQNVSYPSEEEIVSSNFNYWASHKRLAIVHEIYAGHSSKAYNKLKSIITDHNIMVNEKYMPAYSIENWIHFFACSNSVRALKLSMDDRRWFVPKIAENQQNMAYWQGFNKWLQLEGGLGIILDWAYKWLEENAAVERGAIAPWSRMKKEVVEEGYSDGQQWAFNFLQVAKERSNGHGVLMTDMGLRDGIRTFVHDGRRTDYLESGLTLRKLAKSCGWYVGNDYVRVGTARAKLIGSTAALASGSVPDAQPLDVVQKAREWMSL